MPLDVLDHLGVVVRGQERLVLAARRHRQAADEIGEPRQPAPASARDARASSGRRPRPRRRSRGRSRPRSTACWKRMKFAIRISSIRRIASNACRSCSSDSSSMWRDSLASRCAQRVDALAARGEQSRHRILGQPVDLQVRDGACAARARSRGRGGRGRGRSAMTGRAPACRASALRAAARRPGAGIAEPPIEEVVDQRVDLGREARLRAVAGAGQGCELGAGHRGDVSAARERRDEILVAVDQQHGAGDLAVHGLVDV